MFGKDGVAYSYKAKYMGGHSAYPKEMDVSLILNPESLDIPEFPTQIQYPSITSVQSVGKDKLSAMRLLFVGILAFAWKKKQTFMVPHLQGRARHDAESGVQHSEREDRRSAAGHLPADDEREG